MREEGYYFVKYAWEWKIAYWSDIDQSWDVHGLSEYKHDEDLKEIGDKIELPE